MEVSTRGEIRLDASYACGGAVAGPDACDIAFGRASGVPGQAGAAAGQADDSVGSILKRELGSLDDDRTGTADFSSSRFIGMRQSFARKASARDSSVRCRQSRMQGLEADRATEI